MVISCTREGFRFCKVCGFFLRCSTRGRVTEMRNDETFNSIWNFCFERKLLNTTLWLHSIYFKSHHLPQHKWRHTKRQSFLREIRKQDGCVYECYSHACCCSDSFSLHCVNLSYGYSKLHYSSISTFSMSLKFVWIAPVIYWNETVRCIYKSTCEDKGWRPPEQEQPITAEKTSLIYGHHGWKAGRRVDKSTIHHIWTWNLITLLWIWAEFEGVIHTVCELTAMSFYWAWHLYIHINIWLGHWPRWGKRAEIKSAVSR